MENRSTHYGDVAKWIEKVIDSCETYQQTITAKQLVINFEKQLMRTTPDKYWRYYQYGVIRYLEHELDNKRNSFIDKIEE
jgi:hypothetical protein